MSETKSTAVTAILRADLESFAASTLYGQGWSVLYRALEWHSLIEFLDSSPIIPDVLLCSTDLIGITAESIEQIKVRGIKLFLFRSEKKSSDLFPTAISMPASPLELIGLVRGSIRAPLVRDSPMEREKIRAKVLGITSAHTAAGCTTLAINLASELGASGNRTLLVDAHSYAPSIAILLGEQGLQNARGYQQLTGGFWAMEITQSNSVESIAALDIAAREFDFIIIDLGPTHELAQVLSGRRWSGETFVWVASHADKLWVMAKSDQLSIERLRKLTQDLLQNSIKPEISFIHSCTKSGRRSNLADEIFAAAVRALGSKRIHKVPFDARAITAAESANETLIQSNERSLLRKSIEALTGEIGR